MVAAGAAAVVDQVVVGQVVGSHAALHHVVVAGVPEVVASNLHPVVEEVARGVDSGHVGGGDSAAAAAHAAAAHTAHHVAGEVGAALVVDVVAVEDKAELRLVGEAAYEGVALIPEFALRAVARGKVGPDSAEHVAEQAAHHSGLHGEVDHRLLLTVVDSRELGLLRLLLDDLELVDHLGGDVLGCELGVVEEEGLAVDGDLGDGLAVGGYGAVFGHLHSGELLEQVLEHVVVGGAERGRVIFYGVFLDYHRIAERRDGGCVDLFGVGAELYLPQVDVGILDLYLSGVGLVAQEFGLEGVGAAPDGTDGDVALVVAERVLRRGVLTVSGD